MSTKENMIKSRENLNRARTAAKETERARFAAESAHAQDVAEALSKGQSVPNKPATLSALQAADSSTEQALVMLQAKVKETEQEHQRAERGAAMEVAAARLTLRSERLQRAMSAIRAALEVVADEFARPTELARALSAFAETLQIGNRRGYLADREKACARAAQIGFPLSDWLSQQESQIDLRMLLHAPITDPTRIAITAHILEG
jgi:chromosome segregation ATPase